MERITRSWQLLKASWSVLRTDKDFVVFPIVSSLAAIAVSLVFLGLWFTTGGIGRMEGQTLGIVDLVLLFLFYVVAYSVVIFCNSALIAAANIRLDGGDPTLADGFRAAMSRLPAILGWAVIAATVGLVLRALAERGGAVGFVVSLIGGVAWTLVTFLVVPVLVLEGVGPVDALKRSASLLRQTWGEQVVGTFSVGIVVGLAFVALMVVGGAITMLLFGVASALGVVAAVILVAALVTLTLVGTALSGIFNVALYRYAVGKGSDEFFASDTLAGAFRTR